MRKRLLSGMRPTGKLHLGHLVGALKNWVSLQKDYECFFMVADWHALMSEYEDSSHIREYSLDNVADWISCGLDPKKSTIFIQSDVSEHLDLFMFFSCLTPLGWLERCPTYKEQLQEIKTRDLHTFAFLGYPVLQAADILLYKATVVPVGNDQLPHLEITREIGRRFNHLYKKPLFPDPHAVLTEVPRLLGLDGRKMSKSYNNTVDLSDSAAAVKAKVASMITDPKRIRKTDPGHPEICNVHSYYEVFAPEMKRQVEDYCRNAQKGCTECKAILADKLNEILEPIQEKRRALLKDKNKLTDILTDGAKKAKRVAGETLEEVRKVVFR
ncbi:MAG: tryptophan--tRNA ligase [Candidatus Omnitrophota bacterium]|nr:tryptophan--tRNA ligase [Candidatus Omnitrophota bacterium]